MKFALPPETLGWSDPANSTYEIFASFDYASSIREHFPMLLQHDDFSHGTANAPVNAIADASAKAAASASVSASASASASAFRVLVDAHRAEAFIILTQGEATLTLPPLD
ncbi:uncharacterized protein LAJ45_11608 [Morchella importuna]|uniref:uncharacterized protein n=1 Tax=Morchella importuna TaxID=1174673 RepID=UPI001E8CD90C|nr:uncharacterized protein LAJ45_11608 [Morchella importuna]KAH8144408.1 hypothetical protein LAJ45_11608 [Morchella importuna]